MWAQRYDAFEKFISVLVAIKFVTVVSIAVLVGPDIPAMFDGLVPRLPEGSVINVLGLIGGVGGTITIASYGYWVSAKKWNGIGWLPMMRLDNAVGYVMTGIFVVAMLVIGAGMLLGENLTEDDSGLLTLGAALGDEYGDWARIWFLVGFLAVTISSLLGMWNGVSLLFTTGPARCGCRTGAAPRSAVASGRAGVPERGRGEEHAVPLLPGLADDPADGLLFLDQPFAVTLAYGVLGAAFMPFLGITLMLLLNSRRVEPAGKSGWLSNVLLAGSSVLFSHPAGERDPSPSSADEPTPSTRRPSPAPGREQLTEASSGRCTTIAGGPRASGPSTSRWPTTTAR